MKKIILIVVLLLFTFQSKAFAQQVSLTSLFDYSAQTRGEFNSFDKTSKEIPLLPLTKITIDPGTFLQPVQVVMVNAHWDKVKGLLPTGQSPIASYYLTFADNSGNFLTPTKPIHLDVINNVTGTNTYFYPIDSSGKIDTATQKTYNGQIELKTDLPIGNPAFIVAVNKELAAPESANAVSAQSTTVAPKSPLSGSPILTIVILIIALVAVGAVLFALLFVRVEKK